MIPLNPFIYLPVKLTGATRVRHLYPCFGPISISSQMSGNRLQSNDWEFMCSAIRSRRERNVDSTRTFRTLENDWGTPAFLSADKKSRYGRFERRYNKLDLDSRSVVSIACTGCTGFRTAGGTEQLFLQRGREWSCCSRSTAPAPGLHARARSLSAVVLRGPG